MYIYRIAKTKAIAIIMSGNKEIVCMKLQGKGLTTNTFASLYVQTYTCLVAATLSFYCIYVMSHIAIAGIDLKQPLRLKEQCCAFSLWHKLIQSTKEAKTGVRSSLVPHTVLLMPLRTMKCTLVVSQHR